MSGLATYHAQQMERLSSDFFEDGDGLRAVARRTETVDDIVRGRFEEVFGGPADIAAIAVGGYGRNELFPHSDIDLLLLFRRNRDVPQHKDRIAELLALLWDSKLRVSHSVRDPGECARLAPDNTELHISLLDTRFVAGDQGFAEEFRSATLPKFYLREQKPLLRSLAEAAQRRHRSFGRTPYHLEPNLKEGPGGLRDYHLARWVAQLSNIAPNRLPTSEEFLPRRPEWDIDEAKRFLFAVRCYLHHYYGRDKNLLSYDMQDAIAHAGAGKVYPDTGGVADLMRVFFRFTRSIHRLALRLVDEASAPPNALLAILRRRKSRLSNRDFSVTRGQIYFHAPRALESQPDLALAAFAFQARHGLPLAEQTERRLRNRLSGLAAHFDAAATHWPVLRDVLLLPHTYRALEAMRESGVLYTLFPDFELIDCLVIRDFYHRYTVDEHTLVTIKVLKELDGAKAALDQRFAGLLREVARKDLLYFALLFHDVGKGVQGSRHDDASAEFAAKAMRRVGLADPQDRETVLYLVREHLSMSEVMTKRDLSETAVLDDFKRRVGTLERLRLLTLLTYADTVGVNPGSVTSWRKELLWRLYLGVYAVFQRDHEDKRIQPDTEAACLELAADESQKQRLKRFLRGFPERYLRTRSAEEVLWHASLARDLEQDQASVSISRREGHYEIVVLGWERPFLFAALCAAIASAGLNIEHAEAFSNASGLILDSFRVTASPGRPSEDFDPSELERFEQRLRRVSEGRLDASELLRARRPVPRRRRAARPPNVSFDNDTSAKASIFYVQADDRSQLLYDLASVFSQHACDIDVVLSQTQGQRAIDVFYLRQERAKLSEEACRTLQAALLEACAPA